MQPKRVNQEIKKNFILYKGHTGWKVKTRIFGSLLVTFSTLAMLGTVNEVSGQAATTATDVNSATPAATQPASTPASSATQPTTAAENTVQSQAGQATTSTNDNNSESSDVTTTTVPTDADITTHTAKPAAVPEAESVSTDTNQTTTYPVLSPNSSVNVGADTTQVSLTADQIAGHFTATVENRGADGQYMDKDTDPTDNTHTVKIGTDGTVDLTTNDPHQYYISAGQSTTVTGHQVAHVSFEHEIDFSHNFSMSGALGIGSKSSGGADSVGFVFAPGDPAKATEGGSGGDLGLGGLANAFGFVFDEYYNSDKNDPSNSPYIGWRTTDANGNLQYAPSGDWKRASQAGLNDRSVNTLNDFRMTYNATTQMLTVALGNNGTTLTRKITNVSSGYSLSVAASTGGSWNDYSARIDQFSYTPKTIPLTINLVDTADSGALLDKTNANVVANIGDTISVFSTQAAADRAVALGEVDPNLVSVLPTDSAGNVYVIDGSATIANNTGTVHYIGGTQNKALADATYYTYTVADGDGQHMTVPVRLAFTAVVTPVDSQTQQPIPGLKPVTVVTVAGEPALVQIPGYTPTQVVLDAPTDGQKVAQDNLLINQGTANPDGTTPTTKTSDAIAHYYTVTGTTVDGQTVVKTVTVGTGQSITTELNQGWHEDANGNPIASGGKAVIDDVDYYWSEVGSAGATDSTDASHPQTVGSVLVPTATTLKYWDQQAIANQTQADQYKSDAKTMFDQFIALGGLTADQKAAAQASLDAITKIYTDVSDSNATAKTAFETAEQATDAATIYQGGQTGYASLQKAQNLLVAFKADLTQLDTTNKAAQNSLVTLGSWDSQYGDAIGLPTVSFGDGFGTLTEAQKAGFNQPSYFEYTKVSPDGAVVVPTDVGQYFVNVTDAGRAYLKSLDSTNPNLGLFVSGVLNITPKSVDATIQPVTVTYGDTPVVTGDLGETADQISQSDFELIDTATGKTVSASDLQVTGQYMVQYTAAAQAKFKKNANYDFKLFGNAKLTVTPKAITVTAQDTGKAYGDQADPTLTLTSDSSAGLVDGDQLADLGVKLSRESGETAGSYHIDLDPSSTLNSNYNVAVTKGTFTIAKLPVTVQIVNADKTYGEADPTFQLSAESKAVLVNGDSLADLGTITYTRVPGETVGSCAISGSADGQSKNYDVTVADGSLTINKRKVTVKVADSAKTYGNADPSFELAAESKAVLVNGDSLTDLGVITYTRAPGEDVGSYTISGSADGQSKNYTVTVDTGNLTVNKRKVTVKVADATKTYGTADPTFDLNTDAQDVLVKGDQLSDLGTITYTRVSGENVGSSYAISGSADGQSKNYTVTVDDGNLTINQRKVTVTADSFKKQYGDDDPQLTYQVTDGTVQAGDDLGITLIRQPGKTIGSYDIDWSKPATNGNYDVTFNSGKLTIDPRVITVKIADSEKKYGDDDPTFELTDESKSVLVNGDSLTDLGTVTYTRELGETVGSYQVSGSIADQNENYTVTVNSGNLTINKRQVTVKAADSEKTYGDDDPTFNLTDESKTVLVKGDSLADLGVITYTRAPGEKVGSYTISGSADGQSKNYDVKVDSGNLKIDKRTITVKVANSEKVYGDGDPTFNLTDESKAVLIKGDNLSDLGIITYTRAKGENVGSYAISGSADGQSMNYTVNVDAGNLAINKRLVTVKIADSSKTYGTADPTFELDAQAQNVLVNGDRLSDLGTITYTRKSGENIGSYAISGSVDGQGSNYAVTVVDSNLTIDKRSVTVTADSLEKQYGDDDPELTYQVTEGAVHAGDDLGITLTRQPGKAAGSYDIEWSEPATNNNYNVTFNSGKFMINPRKVTVKVADSTKTYGEADPTFELTADSQAVLINGDHLSDLGTITYTRDSGENVDSYAINGSVDGQGSNYAVTVNAGNLTINQRKVTVTADSWKKQYGDDEPTLTYQVTDGTVHAGDDLGITLVRQTGETVGSYDIELSKPAANANYDIKFNSGKLTIDPRTVTVKIADNEKTYGEADPTFELDAQAQNVLVNGDRLSDFGTITYTRKPGENIGSYVISGSVDGQGSNYAVTVENGNLTINQRQVTVTADSFGKHYGEADPALTYQITTGKVMAGDDLELKLDRQSGEDVGSYAISAPTLAGNQNYDVTVKAGTLTIDQQPVTVIADTLTKIYGDQDPTLTYKVVGAVKAGDDLGITLVRDTGEAVGNYAIRRSAPAANKNYDVTYQGSQLNITRKAVTVTADTLTKIYGDQDPTLTYKVVGAVKAGDDLGITLVRDTGEAVGNYAIRRSAPAANKNYDVTYQGSQLTIDPQAIVVTADTLTKIYGEKDPALTYKVSGTVKPGDDLGVTLTRQTGENVGNYVISQSASATNKNYAITFNDGQLVIKPRPVTVTADSLTKIYGEKDSGLTYQITTGKVMSGDDLAVKLVREAGENVGNYQISAPTEAGNQNYAVTVTPGTLTITPADASLEIGNVAMTYGDQPIFNEKFSAGLRLRDLNQTDFEVVDQHNTVIAPDQLKADGNYTIRLTDAGKAALLAATPNYKFTDIKLGQLVVAKRKVTVQVANQLQYAGAVTPQNDISLVAGTLFSDDDLSALRLALTTPDTRAVGTYAITAVAENANYDVTVLPGQLTVLGRDVAADGTVTITEKDADGQVVRITKQWPDQTTTIYSNDPRTNQQVVTELVDQRVVSQQTITPGDMRVILPDGTGAVTVVNVIDPEKPSFEHYAVDPDGDGVSSADELAMGTDPLKADTDGDGIDDGTELRNRTNPLVADAPQKLEEPQRVATVKPLTSTVAKQQPTPSKQSATKLPQTSDEASHGLTVLGLVLMTFLTGLVTRKRH